MPLDPNHMRTVSREERLIRQKIEVLIAPGWARLAALAGRLQAEARTRLPDTQQRRLTLERIFTGPAADLALAGSFASVSDRIRVSRSRAVIRYSSRRVRRAALWPA